MVSSIRIRFSYVLSADLDRGAMLFASGRGWRSSHRFRAGSRAGGPRCWWPRAVGL